MFIMFVMMLPFINMVMVLVWALAGENQSRKNYFRALILWFLFWVAIGAVLMALGFASVIAPWVAKQLEIWRKALGGH
jgi:Na+/H+-dicarboxylate symporter